MFPSSGGRGAGEPPLGLSDLKGDVRAALRIAGSTMKSASAVKSRVHFYQNLTQQLIHKYGSHASKSFLDRSGKHTTALIPNKIVTLSVPDRMLVRAMSILEQGVKDADDAKIRGQGPGAKELAPKNEKSGHGRAQSRGGVLIFERAFEAILDMGNDVEDCAYQHCRDHSGYGGCGTFLDKEWREDSGKREDKECGRNNVEECDLASRSQEYMMNLSKGRLQPSLSDWYMPNEESRPRLDDNKNVAEKNVLGTPRKLRTLLPRNCEKPDRCCYPRCDCDILVVISPITIRDVDDHGLIEKAKHAARKGNATCQNPKFCRFPDCRCTRH